MFKIACSDLLYFAASIYPAGFATYSPYARYVPWRSIWVAYIKQLQRNMDNAKWEDTKLGLETLRNFMCLGYASDNDKYFAKIIPTTRIKRFGR